MNRRHYAWPATGLIIACAMLLGGCGWFSDDSSQGNASPGASGAVHSTLNLMRGIVDMYIAYDIYTVNPNRGPLPGGESVHITGYFPDVVNAESIYTVYFGNNIAPYDSVASAYNVYDLYVVVPPGDALGFVDVNLIEAAHNYYIASEPDGYQYIDASIFEIYAVIPDNGHIRGGNPVRINGIFPVQGPIDNLVAANLYYNVYFGTQTASFDASISPLITSEDMYVIAPLGIAVETVNVRIFSTVDGIYNVYDPRDPRDDYTYTQIMEIYRVYPDVGPTSGGQMVQIHGNFPVEQNIFDINIANSIYEVYFDYFRQPLDSVASPIIGFQATNAIYDEYYFINITTEPHPIGFVDVTVYDLSLWDPPVTLDRGYEYVATVGDRGIQQWVDCEVSPNPVGPLLPGELQVRIQILGTFLPSKEDFVAFIVPQGGNPNNPAHRIPLEYDATNAGPDSSNDEVWYGTNSGRINTIIDASSGTLYADGHAAVYLQDGLDGSILLGDDFAPPYDEGGLIQIDAHTGRHFLIDTLPPIMYVQTDLTANDFVAPNVGSSLPNNADLPTHPYPRFAGFRQFVNPAPWDDGLVTPVPFFNPLGAQQFFNAASISNNILGTLSDFLTFSVNVRFIDLDLHTLHGLYPPELGGEYAGGVPLLPSTLDTDLFLPNSSGFRQPAGFGTNTISFSGDELDALQFNGASDGNARPRFRSRWFIQPGSTRLPDIDDIEVTYLPGDLNVDSGFMNVEFDLDTQDLMQATWDFTPGINPLNVDDIMQLIVKFGAADQATAYFPRGDTNELPRIVVTPEDMQTDPLQLWWMRDVRTEFVQNNIPGSGVTQTPLLTWHVASQPRPSVTVLNEEFGPFFTYRLWWTEQSANTEEFRNGPFTQFMDWTTWNQDFAMAPVLFNQSALLDPNRVNRWYLLTVLAVDEAGNAEQFPVELNHGGSGNANTITFIDPNDPDALTTTNLGGTNWQRFYVPAQEGAMDTFVTPTFWHNRNTPFDAIIDANETNYGSDTVVPLPAASQFFPTANIINQRVEARFDIQAVSNVPINRIEYRLDREGIQVHSGFINVSSGSVFYPGNFTFSIPPSLLGDPNRVRPVNYVFRAWAIDSEGNPDSTPANLRFVVVPSVSQYIQNRQSEDEQPIKEFDRP